MDKLTIKNLDLYYSEFKALKNINLNIQEKEITAFIGPSGCGKSTLLHLIAGLLKPEAGIITYRGNMIPGGSANLGYMLQRDELLEWRSIYANIILGLEIQHKMNSENKARVWHFLSTYGLKSFAYSRPSELSGGMRQRAALIRTLVLNPDILLLDEPTAALDPIAENDIYMKYSEMTQGKTSMFISHRLASTRFCDRIIFVADGGVKEEGTHESLLALGGEYANLFEVQSRYYQEGKEF